MKKRESGKKQKVVHPIKIFNRLKIRDVRGGKEMTKIESKYNILFDSIVLA